MIAILVILSSIMIAIFFGIYLAMGYIIHCLFVVHHLTCNANPNAVFLNAIFLAVISVLGAIAFGKMVNED